MLDYILENQKDYLFYDHTDIVTVKAHVITTIHVKPLKEVKSFVLRFRVMNAVTIINKHPIISLNVYTVQN